jgi:predicted DNA binding CopG/RHH family protein
MNKPLPHRTTDADAERFVDEAELSGFDLSAFRSHSFEFAPKTKQVNMRFSENLLSAVKQAAAAKGMSYQRFIRHALEAAIQPKV